VYLPDLGHTCRSEDKRDSLSKYAAVWELWLPHLVPLEPRLTKHHHLGYWNTFFCTWISSSSSNKIMAFRRQREYKVIFIYLDCIETIQGNSALPSPQLTDLLYLNSPPPPFPSFPLPPYYLFLPQLGMYFSSVLTVSNLRVIADSPSSGHSPPDASHTQKSLGLQKGGVAINLKVLKFLVSQ
jgi:hypothetical protein